MLTVTCKSLGRRRALLDDFAVPPPPGLGGGGAGGGPPTLRELIGHVVRHEVAAFDRRRDGRRLDRVLSAAATDDALDRAGRAAPGAADARLSRQRVDPDHAVAAALQAFEDGVYLVAVDGEPQRDLDAPVYLADDSKLAFVRLTFLAGA